MAARNLCFSCQVGVDNWLIFGPKHMTFGIEIKHGCRTKKGCETSCVISIMDVSVMQNFEVIELSDKLSIVGVFIHGNGL
jgi:hypothetical protein